MPLIGLIDRKGREIPWQEVAKGKGSFEDPVPVLMALHQDREKYCDFSITELVNDPYIVQLVRRYDYFESCDDLADRILGMAIHALMEKHKITEGAQERKLTVKIDNVTIGGTPDLIIGDV